MIFLNIKKAVPTAPIGQVLGSLTLSIRKCRWSRVIPKGNALHLQVLGLTEVISMLATLVLVGWSGMLCSSIVNCTMAIALCRWFGVLAQLVKAGLHG